MPEQRFVSLERVFTALPEQRADIERALLSPIAAEVIALEIQAEGFPISPSTIRTYRRLRRREQEPSQ